MHISKNWFKNNDVFAEHSAMQYNAQEGEEIMT